MRHTTLEICAGDIDSVKAAAAGGADDGQSLTLLQRESDVLQHTGGAEVFFDVVYF